ncbi:MAG: GIY-YIG nuclease family protein [bacterium]
MYFVYILKCKDNSLYTGITTDVTRRFVEHKNKVGAHYTTAHGVKEIVYLEECNNRSVATKREIAIKKLTRQGKLDLIGSMSSLKTK